MFDYPNKLMAHYQRSWGAPQREIVVSQRMLDLEPEFRVLAFGPRDGRRFITYATRGMSTGADGAIELHLFSQIETDDHAELLTAIAHFHRSTSLDLGHTVNFGRPWLPDSKCSYGLISLPYLDGPTLEYFQDSDTTVTRCYWLIPITQSERAYKMSHGQEALERRFEESRFEYWRPDRRSVV